MCICDFGKPTKMSHWAYFIIIIPANNHNHTLPIHSGITRHSWLIYFTIASFASHLKSQPRQSMHGPNLRHQLDGRHQSEIVVRHLLGPLGTSTTYGWYLLDYIASLNNLNRQYNLSPAAHPLLPLTYPSPACPPP